MVPGVDRRVAGEVGVAEGGEATHAERSKAAEPPPSTPAPTGTPVRSWFLKRERNASMSIASEAEEEPRKRRRRRRRRRRGAETREENATRTTTTDSARTHHQTTSSVEDRDEAEDSSR